MSAMTRGAVRLLIPVLLGGGLLVSPLSPASPAQAAGCSTSNTTRGDVDGDGFADLIVGQPGANGGLGAVKVRTHAGVVKTLSLSSLGLGTTSDDRFGASVVTADLNSDGCDDLIIGAPGRDNGTGAVVIARSTGVGFVGQDVFNGPQEGAEYGRTVAVLSPLKGPAAGQTSTIVGGAPFYTVGSTAGAGAIVVRSLSAGLVSGAPTTITQNTPGIPGTAEAQDQFGSTLAASGKTIAVGTPFEDVGAVVNAGAVTLITPGSTPGTYLGKSVDQNTPGVSSLAETNDVFGWSLALLGSRLVVGVPGEMLGGLYKTGMIHQFSWTESTRSLSQTAALDQNSSGVPGTNEIGDSFGWSVAIIRGGLNPGATSVAVGAPFEDIGSVFEAGSVTVLQLSSGGTLSASRSLTQGSLLPDTAEAGDYLGYAVAALPGNESISTQPDGLAMGAPTEDFGAISQAGTVAFTYDRSVTFGSFSGTSAGQRLGGVLSNGAFGAL